MWDLLEDEGSCPSRVVKPRERPVFSLGEVIEEGSNVFLNGTILGGLRVQSLKLSLEGTPPKLFPHTQGFCVDREQGDLNCCVKG